MPRAYLILALHAHLPFVRHPEHREFLEERWLFEAITETYLPLLALLERLLEERIPCRFTLSLSPTLICMLQDPLLQRRYLRHLSRLSALAERESRRKGSSEQERILAVYYLNNFRTAAHRFEQQYQRDLLGAYRKLAQAGVLELITSAATHGFLPLLRTQPSSVRAQLQVASALFEQRIGWPAPGVWLPECGYYPGLEDEIVKAGFHYCFLETHGITHATPKPRHACQTPLACRNGVAVFGRDPDCSQEVWSGRSGYPGHPQYREFYRDIGFERSAAELGDFYLAELGEQSTSMKYHRVTDRNSEEKALYDPPRAQLQARRHAEDFVRKRIAAAVRSSLRERPVAMVAPYDAELFGHWWFEGPVWLEQVARAVAANDQIAMLTPSDYLQRHGVLPLAQAAASTWGEGGYNAYWMNSSNAWIYPHLQHAAQEMHELASLHAHLSEQHQLCRLLNQAGRSLLLAQASDWPFIMHSGASVDYAVKRIESQLARFRYLTESVKRNSTDERRLLALEEMDNIFPDLDFRVFAA